MEGTITIRLAESADASSISALLRDSFIEFEPLYTPEAFAATVLSESAVVARMLEGPVWFAERRGTIVGTVAVKHVPGSVLVRGMAVIPIARGAGVGRLLLDQAERFAIEGGIHVLSLYTTAFLKSAIQLYRNAGFVFTGEIIVPHGTELLRMEKHLSQPQRG